MIRRVPHAALRDDPARPLFAPPRARAVPSSECTAARRKLLAALFAEELSLAPARVYALAQRELAGFRGEADVALSVHPDDLPLFADVPALARELEIARLTVLPDPALTRGGCTISAERGELDARVETRIARLLALLEGSPHERS